MATFFGDFGRRYTDHMLKIGRKHARDALMGKSDRLLADIGISRALLEKGIDHWPWTLGESDVVQLAPKPVVKQNRREERRAIRALRALSDRELSDMGITRGSIAHAVRYGRPRDNEVAKLAKPVVMPTTLKPADKAVAEQPVAERLQAA